MKKKVVYIINYAPNYRNTFLEELAKFIDLTVISFNGSHVNLKDPEIRNGYKYIELKQKRLLNVSFNFKEFTEVAGSYDVIIIGYNLRNPFRLLNLIRKNRVILEGLMYGKNDNFLIALCRKFVIRFSEGVLVYSKMVQERLEKEVSKPIISFNNTSFTKKDIQILPFPEIVGKLHLLWVGRYQERKKIERLVDLAKRDKRVHIRLIGPGIKEKLGHVACSNLEIYDSVYEKELDCHFLWSHAVFNPSHAGLIVMNAARYGRPIFIDECSQHAPEIQLAKEANQKFIDFGNNNKVNELVNFCFENPRELEVMGIELAKNMSNYTVEYMAQQYLKAINNDWDKK